MKELVLEHESVRLSTTLPPRPKPVHMPNHYTGPTAGALPFPRPQAVSSIGVRVGLLGLGRRRMCGRWRFEFNADEWRVLLGVFRPETVEVPRVAAIGGLECCQTGARTPPSTQFHTRRTVKY